MEIIREGDGGDFMLMLISGKVEVHKRDRWNTPQLLATVEAGRTLGEMSMIDGEARFATCIAARPRCSPSSIAKTWRASSSSNRCSARRS